MELQKSIHQTIHWTNTDFAHHWKKCPARWKKKPKQLLKTSLKANLKTYQDPKIETTLNTFWIKSILSQIPSSLNIGKIALF